MAFTSVYGQSPSKRKGKFVQEGQGGWFEDRPDVAGWQEPEVLFGVCSARFGTCDIMRPYFKYKNLKTGQIITQHRLVKFSCYSRKSGVESFCRQGGHPCTAYRRDDRVSAKQAPYTVYCYEPFAARK
ncbi:hypothetical protein E4U55_008157 [Claviceps digitariae]|nr:hypothetical protein E4U55_008157 [Claviceps digitariae]